MDRTARLTLYTQERKGRGHCGADQWVSGRYSSGRWRPGHVQQNDGGPKVAGSEVPRCSRKAVLQPSVKQGCPQAAETTCGRAEVVAERLWDRRLSGRAPWAQPAAHLTGQHLVREGAGVRGALALGGRRVGPALAEESRGLRQGASRSGWGGHCYTFTTRNSSSNFETFFFVCFLNLYNVLLVPALQQPGIIIRLSPPSSASLLSPTPPL